MAARIIGLGLLGVIILASLLVAVYLVARVRDRSKAKPELDTAVRPSQWRVSTRATENDTRTQISIVRVDLDSNEILERRVLHYIDNAAEDYGFQLEDQQDRAYVVARQANTGLERR